MTLEHQDLRGYLLRHIREKYGTQRAAAKALFMHPATLNDMLAGRLKARTNLLADAGLVARVVYESTGHVSNGASV